MSLNNKKSKNIPAFLQKTYDMLQVYLSSYLGHKKWLRYCLVTQRNRIYHFERINPNQARFAKILQTLELFLLYPSGILLIKFSWTCMTSTRSEREI